MINFSSISNHSSPTIHSGPLHPLNCQSALSNSEEIPKVQSRLFCKPTAFDQFWQDLTNADFINSQGIPTEEISKLYPLGSLNEDEMKTWFNFVTNPIQARLLIQFSIVEFYAFLFTVAPAAGIIIHSANICGGAVPEMFSSYYIRNLNDCYAKHCQDKKLDPISVLISKDGEIAQGFKRKSPDYDLSTYILGNLKMANRLVNKFFAWKYFSRSMNSVYDLKSAVKEAIQFANVLGESLSNNPDEFDSSHFYCEEQILGSFYRKHYSNNDFALSSFGLDDFIIDHNFLPIEQMGRTIFLHNSLNVPSINPIMEIINILNTTEIPLEAILDMNLLSKITPTHLFRNGLASLVARAGKRMIPIDISEIDDSGWGACITNQSIGYDAWEPGLQETLFEITNNDDRLNFVKSKWENHLYKDPLYLIPLGFHALQSLMHNGESSDKCELWWSEISGWYHDEICAINKPNSIPAYEKLPFFIYLKSILDSKSVPFDLCCDVLQLCGCLALLTKNDVSSSINVCLTNHEADWHAVKISQKIDDRVYAISIPLDLHRALDRSINLKEGELNTITSLLNLLRPHKIYDLDLIPTAFFNEAIAMQACKLFTQSSPDLKPLAYEVLLLCAFSNPASWSLSHLINFLPEIPDEQICMTNLKKGLDFFPDTIEMQKLVAPLKSFCLAAYDKSRNARYDLCLEWALAGQCMSAINLYSSLKLSLTEKIKFIKTILAHDVIAALNIFSRLLNDDDVLYNDEVDFFIALVGIVKKNQQQTAFTSQLIALSHCTKTLLFKHGKNPIPERISELISQIIKFLVSSNLAQEANDLLASVSEQQHRQNINKTDPVLLQKAAKEKLQITELRMRLLKRIVAENLWDSNLMRSQLAWISAEYLLNEKHDPNQLLDIHRFLMACLQLESSSKIDINITSALATALIFHKLHSQAVHWIDFSIKDKESKLSEGLISDLGLPIDTWCDMLMEQNQLKHCQKYVLHLKNVKCRDSIKADLYFKIAEASLKSNPAMSARLLLDNWENLDKHHITEDWKTLAHEAFNHWLMIVQESQMPYSDSLELLRLIDAYHHFMRLRPQKDLNITKVEKEFWLLKFKASHHTGWAGLESTFEFFCAMFTIHGDDAEWVDQSITYLANSLIKVTVNSNRYFQLLAYYDVILPRIFKTNTAIFYQFIFKYTEKALEAGLPEGLMRTFILNHIGGSLNCLVTTRTTNDPNEISEIISLVEKYLLSFPVIYDQYSLDVYNDTNEFETFTCTLNHNAKTVNKSRLSERKPLLLKEQMYFKELKKESLPSEETDETNTCTQYFMTDQYFAKKFKLLQNNMQEFGFYKDNPKAALFSQLALIDGFEESNENPLAGSELSPLLQLEVIHDVVKRLNSFQHGPAAHKAMSIMKLIPQSLWDSHINELVDLMIQVLSQDSTYPYCNKIAFDSIVQFIKSNEQLPELLDISSKLCFLLYNKLSTCGSKDDSKKEPPSKCHFHSASLFICSALMQGLIKDDHDDFLSLFKTHFQRLVLLNSHRAERETLPNFIETSFLNNSKHAAKIKEVITPHFNKLIVLKPEFLEMNILLINILFDNDYFKANISKFESLVKNLADEYVKSLSIEPSTNVLASLMQMIKSCKKQLADQLEQKVFTAIDKKLNTLFIFSYLKSALLEKNIDTLSTLKSSNYFNTSKRIEQLDKCSKLIVVQFQNIANNGGNIGTLTTIMKKLFTADEIRKAYSDVQRMRAHFQNISETPPK